MRSPLQAERGSITAETMMVLPAVVLVFSALILGIQASMVHYRLQQEAHANARVASLEEEGLWKLRPLTLSAGACALNPAVGREF